jgi:hypothetical protein
MGRPIGRRWAFAESRLGAAWCGAGLPRTRGRGAEWDAGWSAGLAQVLVGRTGEGIPGGGDSDPPDLTGGGVEVPVDIPTGEAATSAGGRPGALRSDRTMTAGGRVDEA